MVEAIMEERRPKTQAKGKEMARARLPRSDTCSISMPIQINLPDLTTERDTEYYICDQMNK